MSTPLAGRDLLTLGNVTPEELNIVLETAASQKASWREGDRTRPLDGTAVAIVLQSARDEQIERTVQALDLGFVVAAPSRPHNPDRLGVTPRLEGLA